MSLYNRLNIICRFFLLAFGCLGLIACTEADREKIANIDFSLPKLTSLNLNHEERRQYIELQRKNNAAADLLAQRAANRMDQSYRFEMVKLVNLGEPLYEGTPAIEWLIPQQVGARLSQLGYSVKQPMHAPTSGSSAKTAGTLPMQLTNTAKVSPHSHPHRHAGWVYIEGEYAYLNDELLVILRLVGGRTNTILSSVSYDMDVDADLYQLLDPRATDRIFGSAWMQ